MKKIIILTVLVTGYYLLVPAANAQRGVGEPGGVARQAVKVPLVALAGKVVEVKTGPCEKTTGRSPVGVHFILETKDGKKLNIHLGPVNVVSKSVEKLTPGQEVSVKAFRTEKMAPDHYVAQSLVFGGTRVTLHDPVTFRPVWAGRGSGPIVETNVEESKKETRETPIPQGKFGPGYGRGGWGGGPPWARNPNGPGGGKWNDSQFSADREVFHFLLQNHQKVQRKVTERKDGVETLNESDDPAVTLAIQGHAAAMKRRVEEGRPIHLRDPLFAALFSKAGKIQMNVVKTDKGVRIIETSDDPLTVQLIQAHARVVSQFVANGFQEAWQNHPVPELKK